MTAPRTTSGHAYYAEAMRFAGTEALARLSVADRLVDAEREAVVAALDAHAPHTRPVLVSLGALLVRIGERLEAAATPQCRKEYA